MGRGAPNKKGLSYFPKMIDFYEDDKVFDLLDRYGPLGVTVYDCILCIVYKQGYYAEISLDKLSRMITRMIGKGVGETVEFGGLLGYAPIMPVNQFSCEAFVERGGRIPAPIHSFKN